MITREYCEEGGGGEEPLTGSFIIPCHCGVGSVTTALSRMNSFRTSDLPNKPVASCESISLGVF